jgi:hypothetical protein
MNVNINTLDYCRSMLESKIKNELKNAILVVERGYASELTGMFNDILEMVDHYEELRSMLKQAPKEEPKEESSDEDDFWF